MADSAVVRTAGAANCRRASDWAVEPLGIAADWEQTVLETHDTQRTEGSLHAPHPPDWSSSDSVLERLIAHEDTAIRVNRRLAIGALGLLGLVIAALVLSVIALNRDINSVAKAEPKDNSVGTSALRDGAVTSGKLADGGVTAAKLGAGAVLNPALADSSVGHKKLRQDAVDSSTVAPESLTGADISEGTLAKVPLASRADVADQAGALDGVPASQYLSGIQVSTGAGTRSLRSFRTQTATCPAATRVLGGGAAIEGTVGGVAIVESSPDGPSAWRAVAEATGEPDGAWRLVVTAICARGGG